MDDIFYKDETLPPRLQKSMESSNSNSCIKKESGFSAFKRIGFEYQKLGPTNKGHGKGT